MKTNNNKNDTDQRNRETNQFALRIQSKRGTVDQWVGIEAKSKGTARKTFENNWTGYEVKVRIPHHNGHKWETVFAPTENSAKTAASGRSGEYSDVPSDIQLLEIDVQITEAIHADEIKTLEQERALDELSRINYEVENAT